jgi:WD40 repeat protein/HEAT repeat protein
MRRCLSALIVSLIVCGQFAHSGGRGTRLLPPFNHQAHVTGLLFSPDGKLLLLQYPQGCVLLDARTGKRLQHSPQEPRGFEFRDVSVGRLYGGAAFGPGRQVFLVCELQVQRPRSDGGGFLSSEAGVVVWQHGTESRRLWRTDPAPERAGAVALSADGKRAVTGDPTGRLRIWELPSGRLVGSFDRGPRAALNPLVQIRLVPGGRRAVCLARNGLELWDLSTGQAIRLSPRIAFPFALSPTGRLAVSVEWRSTNPRLRSLVLWELATGKVVRNLPAHGSGPVAGAFTPDGRALLCVGGDGTFRHWDLLSGKPLWSRRVDSSSAGTTATAFSPDGKRAATANAAGVVKLWDAETGEFVRLLSGSEEGSKDEVLVSLLARRSRDGDAAVRRKAIEDLARLGKGALPLLALSLRDPAAAVRLEAVRGLSILGEQDRGVVRAALQVALKDRDARVRVETAYALHLLDDPQREVLEALGGALHDGDVSVRLHAVEALGKLCANRLWSREEDAKLCSALASLPTELSGDLRQALGSRLLLGALKDARVEVRRKAAVLLSECRMLQEERTAALLGALKDADGAVRVLAVQALNATWDLTSERVGPQPGYPAQAVAVGLAGALREGDRDVRRRAARLLRKLGPQAKAAADALRAATGDPDCHVRVYAAVSCLRIDRKAPVAKVLRDAVPELVAALLDGQSDWRGAMHELVCLGEPVVPGLVWALESARVPRSGADPSRNYRTANEAYAALKLPGGAARNRHLVIAETLSLMGPEARAAAPALVKCAGDVREPVGFRVVCLHTLARISLGDRAAGRALLDLVRDRNPLIRSAARQALLQIDPEAARKAGIFSVAS